MKKALLFFVFIAISLAIMAEHVDIEKASVVAVNWINHKNQIEGNFIESTIKDSYAHVFDGKTVFYVFNMNPIGFVIVAADDAAIPIFGYSTDGVSSLEAFPPNMLGFVRSFELLISEISNENKTNEHTIQVWNDIINNTILTTTDRTNIENLVSSNWGQGDYFDGLNYNAYCPQDPNGPNGRTIVGCSAVAMGQIMKYWGYPRRGSGSHSYTDPNYGLLSANFTLNDYSWQLMPDDESSDMTALLLYHLGVSVDTHYGPNESESNPAYTLAKNSLEQFWSYNPDMQVITRSNYSDLEWKNILISQLTAGNPVYYGARTHQVPNPWDAAHAFICSGYRSSSDEFYFNFGDNGWYSCWFSFDAISFSGSTWNHHHSAIINIRPKIGNVSGLSAQATASNHVLLNWNDDSNTGQAGSEYHIERKVGPGQWSQIGTVDTGETSYVDTGVTVPNTNYSYRVRSYHAAMFSNNVAYTGVVQSEYSNVTTIAIPLLAEFSATPLSGQAPLTVTFTNQSVGPVNSYSWNFGDGNTSTQQNPTHVYNSPGTYTVSLTVTSGSATDTKTRNSYIYVSPSQASLTSGGVNPAQGSVDDTFNFSVVFTSPAGIAPGTVYLAIGGQELPMTASGSNWQNGVTFNRSWSTSDPGINHYFFYTQYAGQNLYYPQQPQMLSFNVGQSAVGWDLECTDLALSQSFLTGGATITATATVRNSSNSNDKIYYNVPYDFKLMNSSGSVVYAQTGTIAQLNRGLSVNIAKSIVVPATNGTYQLVFTTYPSLDNNYANNSSTGTVIVGNPGSNQQWYVAPSNRQIQMGQGAGSVTQYSFSGATYTITNVSGSYVSVRRNSEWPQNISVGGFTQYDGGNVILICHWVNTLGNLYAGISFGSLNPNVVSFTTTSISCFPGSSIEFIGTVGTGYTLTDWEPDFYGNAASQVEDWYDDATLFNSNRGARWEFDISSSATANSYDFFFGVDMRQSSQLAMFVRKLTIIVNAQPPQINTLSSYSFSATDNITISGTRFGTSGTVRFNNLVSSHIVSWSNTSIVCRVPVGVTSGSLTVTSNQNGQSNAVGYNVISSTGDPVLVQPIPDQSLLAGSTYTIANLNNVFSDPNNHTLVYTVNVNDFRTSNRISTRLEVDNSVLQSGTLRVTIYDDSEGDVQLGITATDPFNGTATDSFVITIVAIELPELLPPTNLTGLAGNNSVNLSWSPPDARVSSDSALASTDSTNRSLLSYNVYRNDAIVINVPADLMSYIDTDAQNGTTYVYYVTSVYSMGESQPSNLIEVMPIGPPELNISMINNETIRLTWNSSNRNSLFKVYRANQPLPAESDDWQLLAQVSGSYYDVSNANRSGFFYVTEVTSSEGTVATPVFDPQSGTYSTEQLVTISCTTSGAVIRYTIDGSEPSTSSPVYTSPLTISTTTTLKAKAYQSGWIDSNTATATYTISSIPPLLGGFVITADTYAFGSDWDAVIQSVFGSNYRVADWSDLVNYYVNGGDLLELFDGLNLHDYGAAVSLKYNNNQYYSSSRSYFASRHEHNVPPSYMVHAHINNYQISLGSWTGSRKILAIRTNAQ